jgi:hypothetical protein
MSSDGQVTSKMVLDACSASWSPRAARKSCRRWAAEPDLAEHVIEGFTAVYQRLARECSDPRATRSRYRLVRRLVLVGLMSLRRAHYELWRQQAEQTPLAGLDPDGGDTPEDEPPGDGPPSELT